MRGTTRLDTTATVAALVAVTGILVAVAVNHTGSGRAPRPAPAPATGGNATPARTVGAGTPTDAPGATASATAPLAAAPLVLTAADRQDCPAAAAACVDLDRHITWLQGDGKVTFGPVAMEPGMPGGKHPTPRGKFWVQWKAGPSYVSNIYHEPMPWATFFAAGGIAFHGGSLTAWSHGCVHLTDSNAHYFNEYLPVGAEVVVF
jgi:hypothetical protein